MNDSHGSARAPRTLRTANGHRSLVCVAGLSLLLHAVPASRPVEAQAQSERQSLFSDLRSDRWTGVLIPTPTGSDTLAIGKEDGWLYAKGLHYDYVLRYETRFENGGRHRAFFRTLSFPERSYELRLERRGDTTRGELVVRRGPPLKDTSVRLREKTLRPALGPREWHDIEIRCEGQRVAVLVNGNLVGGLEGMDAIGGRIGFAGQGVSYRRARLTARPDDPPFSTAHDITDDGIEKPVVLKEVRPIMPDRARATLQNYAAMIEAVIDRSGHVAAARPLRRVEHDPGYNDEALRVVKLWQFTPARLKGQPVPVKAVFEITFTWEQPRQAWGTPGLRCCRGSATLASTRSAVAGVEG